MSALQSRVGNGVLAVTKKGVIVIEVLSFKGDESEELLGDIVQALIVVFPFMFTVPKVTISVFPAVLLFVSIGVVKLI